MARVMDCAASAGGVRGGGGKMYSCSYKRTTLVICSINIVIALYIFRCLYSSIFLYQNNYTQYNVKFSPSQIEKMQESIRIRKASEPIKLEKVVKNIKKELAYQESSVELPGHVRQMITDEIMQRLRSLNHSANVTEQREAIENWRKVRLQEAKQLARGQGNVTMDVSPDEAEMLVKAMDMESNWSLLMEEIGLYIPIHIVHVEHDDKPEGVDEYEEDSLAGRPLPPQCHPELHTDYDGVAVKWGLTHHKESAADCCQACLDQAKQAKAGEKKCNIWVYCPSESGCYSPDIYVHQFQECWLKYAEKPKLNFKDKYSDSYRNSHPTAPLVVPWVSGVTSPIRRTTLEQPLQSPRGPSGFQ